MKLTLLQIMEARLPLRRLSGKPFPALIAYRIQKSIRAIEPEAVAFQKTRDDLIREKYGEAMDGVPNQYRVKDECLEAFQAEMNTLLAETLELDIRQIPLSALGEITPADLDALEWMIEPDGAQASGIVAEPVRARRRTSKT